MARGVKKTRKEAITKELGDIEAKLSSLNKKIAVLEEQKFALQNEFAEIEAEEIRIAEEKKNQEILDFIKKNNITKDQLQSFILANTNKNGEE